MPIFNLHNIEKLPDLAADLISSLHHKVILLNGELGAGKTTLVKELVKQLGCDEDVTSPTFSIVNEYKTKDDSRIYHIDLYRLSTCDQCLEIGLDEYLYSGDYTFVEWAERMSGMEPDNYHTIDIETLLTGERIITLS